MSETSPTSRAAIGATTLPGRARMILLLAALAGIGQFASNVNTPSLPSVAARFSASTGASQLIVSAYLAAFGLAQLAVGPLADRFGRRPVLFGGLALFLTGAIICATASSMIGLILGRIVEGTGAAASLVVSRAAARDSFEGQELARTLAALTMAVALVPGVTPLVGGAVEQVFGWRGAFWLTALLVASTATFAYRALPETLSHPSPLSPSSVVAGYGRIILDPVFRSNVIVVAFAFASMSAFFSGSPDVMIGSLRISPVEYGFYPPLAVTGFLIGGAVVRRFAGGADPRTLSVIGVSVMLAGTILMYLPPAFGHLHKFAISGAMVVHVTGLGILLPASVAAALQRFPQGAGAAAAVMGFCQMAGGAAGAAVVSALSGRLGDLTFPSVMLAATMLATGAAVVLIPPRAARA